MANGETRFLTHSVNDLEYLMKDVTTKQERARIFLTRIDRFKALFTPAEFEKLKAELKAIAGTVEAAAPAGLSPLEIELCRKCGTDPAAYLANKRDKQRRMRALTTTEE